MPYEDWDESFMEYKNQIKDVIELKKQLDEMLKVLESISSKKGNDK